LSLLFDASCYFFLQTSVLFLDTDVTPIIIQPVTPVIVRPWESANNGHPCETTKSHPGHPTTSSALQNHLTLLNEISLAQRLSLTSVLWIDSLLHSYMFHVNMLKSGQEQHRFIEQTRAILRSYLHTTSQESVKCPTENMSTSERMEVGKSQESCTGRRRGVHFLVSVQTTPATQKGFVSRTPDTGYSSFSDTDISPPPRSQQAHKIGSTTHLQASRLPIETNPGETSSLSSPQFSGTLPSHASSSIATSSCSHNSTKFMAPCARFILEDWYQDNMDCPYASDAIADDLALHVGISKVKVLKWLSNRRNRDGNTKKTVGRRRKAEYNRAKPYTSHRGPQTKLTF